MKKDRATPLLAGSVDGNEPPLVKVSRRLVVVIVILNPLELLRRERGCCLYSAARCCCCCRSGLHRAVAKVVARTIQKSLQKHHIVCDVDISSSCSASRCGCEITLRHVPALVQAWAKGTLKTKVVAGLEKRGVLHEITVERMETAAPLEGKQLATAERKLERRAAKEEKRREKAAHKMLRKEEKSKKKKNHASNGRSGDGERKQEETGVKGKPYRSEEAV